MDKTTERRLRALRHAIAEGNRVNMVGMSDAERRKHMNRLENLKRDFRLLDTDGTAWERFAVGSG